MAGMITAEEFEELYRATAPQLFAYIRRRGVADPEDLAAEVYAIAWRRRIDLPAPFLRRAWLFGTARKLLLSEARRSGRELECLNHIAAQPETEAGENRRLEAAVAAALGRLRPKARELILLAEWEQLTPAEVAVVLGIRPGAARVRLHRARLALAADPDLRDIIGEPPSMAG